MQLVKDQKKHWKLKNLQLKWQRQKIPNCNFGKTIWKKGNETTRMTLKDDLIIYRLCNVRSNLHEWHKIRDNIMNKIRTGWLKWKSASTILSDHWISSSEGRSRRVEEQSTSPCFINYQRALLIRTSYIEWYQIKERKGKKINISNMDKINFK